MFKKCASVTLVITLIVSLTASSVLANRLSDTETESKPAETPPDINTSINRDAASDHKRNEKLRADVEKLLSDARAGKVVLPERRQMKPAKSNNLSTGAKVAIGVGIAVVVLALIVKYQKDHLFDDFRLGN